MVHVIIGGTIMKPVLSIAFFSAFLMNLSSPLINIDVLKVIKIPR